MPSSDPGQPEARGSDETTFVGAAAYLAGSEGANRSDAADSKQLRLRQQARAEEWARARGCIIEANEIDSLELISNSTSEHEVFFRSKDERVVKRTWPGWFGQVPAWINEKLDRRPASPEEYLLRQELHNVIFKSDLRLEGITLSSKPPMIIGEPAGQPSFVISQPFARAIDRRAPAPTPHQINTFLEDQGFVRVPESYFGRTRRADGVALIDARPDNFILTSKGVIPIDLQIAVVIELLGADNS